MSTRIQLSLACGDYDINQGLITGEVVPQGVDLTVVTAPSPERHFRMNRNDEFDICEFSLGSYIMAHGRGDWPVTAIPAFPHRRFRHGYIFVNTGAGIRSARDLNGRRVGIRTWQTTAGLVARGILQDDHGVDLRSITWVAQDEEDIPLQPGHGFRMERAPEGREATEMLEAGELDGLIYPELPDSIRRADPRVARLFPDTKAAEIEHVARTGFFPLMHTVVIRRAVVEAHPWLPRELLTAFEASKSLAFDRMRDPRRVSLAWFAEAMAEQHRILGDDPWAYDFARNRAGLELMIRWSHEQGMIADRFEPEDLFHPSVLADLPHYV
ncbi:MAG: ABC transporter substrate-binding protein [Myxococcales bacterium]|nr:ABC transporter substrate-binding protein [Myxococcales bacterium]